MNDSFSLRQRQAGDGNCSFSREDPGIEMRQRSVDQPRVSTAEPAILEGSRDQMLRNGHHLDVPDSIGL